MAEARAPFTRRSLLRRGGGVAVGAAVMWSAPSIRTSAISSDTAGSPPPVEPQAATPAGTPGAADQVVGANRATLPLTGSDPSGLLLTGGTAIVAGSALLASVHDSDASRGEI